MNRVVSAEMSWRQIEAAVQRGAAAIFPLASTEEHGPHAPTGDYKATAEIARRVAERTGDIAFPCLPFGYSEYFRNYSGTITLQHDTLFRVVEDVVNCLIDQGFKHIILLNGHKGNEAILLPLARKVRRKQGLLLPIVSPFGFALTPALQKELYGEQPIGHGAEPMASIMMYLFPDLVDMDLVDDWDTRTFHGLAPVGLNGLRFEEVTVAFPLDMEDITPDSGSLTDPRPASAEKGQRIVEASVDRIARFVTWFKELEPTLASR